MVSIEDGIQNRKKRKKWSERIPSTLRVVIDWVRWLVRPALALVALYSCLFVLQIIGLAPDLIPGKLPTLSLEIKPDSKFLSDYHWTVTGRTKPYMYVEVGVNQRVVDATWSIRNGSFSVPIATMPQYDIWARVLDPATGEVIGEETVPPSKIPVAWIEELMSNIPVLDVAIFIEDSDWLWVAGRAIPMTTLNLETEEGDLVAVVTVDGFGIFDRLVPLGNAQSPHLLRVRDGIFDSALVSDSVVVTALPLAEIPLARIADIDLKADKPVIHMQIELPSTHPYFFTLAQGYLSADKFVEASFGMLSESWQLDYTYTLSARSGIGVVELTGQWSLPIPEFSLICAYNYFNNRGVGSAPLFTAKDQITLHFSEIRPNWFDDPLPTDLKPGTATWRGPITDYGSFHVIRVGLDLPADLQAQRWRTKPLEQPTGNEKEKLRAEEKMREFLAVIEFRATGDFVRWTWRTLISLIPYVSLLWLAWRHKSGQSEAWKPITALVLVLAIWHSWGYFYFLLRFGPASWLQRIITPARYDLGLGGTGAHVDFLADAGSNAFWLLFILFIALVPLYMPLIEGRLDWRPITTSHQSSFLRRIWTMMRIAYGAIVLALLLLITQFEMWFHSDWFQGTLEQMAYYLQETCRLLSFDASRTVLQITLLVMLLFAFSGRAALWGVGLLAVSLRALSTARGYIPEVLAPIATTINGVPWWVVVVFSGLTAYPLMLYLLRRLAAIIPEERTRLPHRLLALALVFISIALARIPPLWLLVTGGMLMGCAIGWLVVNGLRELELITPLANWARRWPHFFFVILAGAALIIIWPIPKPGTALKFSDLYFLASELNRIFVYILALALILLMRDYASQRRKDRVVLDLTAMEVAIVLFAVFLVNSSRSWLFIPVPFLVGLLMVRFWLFQPIAKMRSQHSLLVKAAKNRKRLIQDILDAASAKTRFEKIRKALTKKLEAAELKPHDYKARLYEYKQEFKQELSLEQVEPGYQSRDIVFAVGETNLWRNTQIVIKYGIVLATIPLLIALYEHLPVAQVRYPYPLANLIVFFIQSIASWLLYAFFFGYYYVHLRGNSGLVKGLCLFVGLVLPFAIYRLLSAQSLEEMQPFFLWVTQVFLFCTLLGLLSEDYRLLRQNGYQMRDLLAVHNLPVLSIYASSVVAAVTPTIIAIITGRLGDVVNFFLETVLPRVPTVGP